MVCWRLWLVEDISYIVFVNSVSLHLGNHSSPILSGWWALRQSYCLITWAWSSLLQQWLLLLMQNQSESFFKIYGRMLGQRCSTFSLKLLIWEGTGDILYHVYEKHICVVGESDAIGDGRWMVVVPLSISGNMVSGTYFWFCELSWCPSQSLCQNSMHKLVWIGAESVLMNIWPLWI